MGFHRSSDNANIFGFAPLRMILTKKVSFKGDIPPSDVQTL